VPCSEIAVRARKITRINNQLPFILSRLIFIYVKYEYLESDMATTSLSLGEHWEVYIKNEIASGRYGSASEVVRDALRAMEERKSKLDALRSHLAQGAEQARASEFIDNFTMDTLINDLDNEA
jgi:antitoxin ParD1/3/4